MLLNVPIATWVFAGVLLAVVYILMSMRRVGPSEIGLVLKRASSRKLTDDNMIAFQGEAGYQADLLLPGVRWKPWLLYEVEKFPWVQIPAGEIGVVIAQVGASLPIGAKSAVYKKSFGNFANLRAFVTGGGQKGVQRPVFPPGTTAPIHPVGFLVRYQEPGVWSPDFSRAPLASGKTGGLAPEAFGLQPDQLELVRIEPKPCGKDAALLDLVGIVTTYEGDPLPSGDIAGRLDGFTDINKMEEAKATDGEVIEVLLGNKNNLHNNYQDFQAFLDSGGRIGLQHDPLLYGAYALNPFLVSVEMVLDVGRATGTSRGHQSIRGPAHPGHFRLRFKFGSLVRPGHRGIWQEALRTGKYPLNPRCYQAEIVPTSILTLNWADAVSQAHNLDAQLQQIVAKSNEGFVFKIDLQVQIHVPDTNAPRVISMVGTMMNLVNEVLQAAVGNHFRDKLQSMPAVRFIETRQQVQEEAFKHINEQLAQYRVETRGVYIQDVILPEDLVKVLTQREIANQEIETYRKQRSAQDERIAMENAKGTAEMQADLAKSKVGVDIKTNNANARTAEARGEAEFIRQTGTARGAEVEAVGLARARGYEAQVRALGSNATALVNVISALSEGTSKFVPDILVTSGSNGGGALDGLAATAMRYLAGSGGNGKPGEAKGGSLPSSTAGKSDQD